MKSKPFLIPVGAAVAALTPGGASAVVNQSGSVIRSQAPEASKPDMDSAVGKMMYQVGPEEHALLLKRSETGNLYAQHQSHASHGSHGSHVSHRSGY